MRTYYGEVADEENWEHCHRVIEVQAEDAEGALQLIREAMKPDESIYQINRGFEDCELAQPVYDFWNEFKLTPNEATARTYKEAMGG